MLACGGEDGTVRLWNTDTHELVSALRGHTGAIWNVALSRDGRLVASGSWDGTVRVWEASTGELSGSLRGGSGVVCGVALSADGQLLASGGDDGVVWLWDVATGACLRTLRSDRAYERVDITRLTGITAAQRAAMLALGAVEQ
jgi:WD40 repeat protein